MPVDYKKYPKNWKKEIVPRILKRAGNFCELCYLENGRTVYSAEVYIQIRNGKSRLGFMRIWLSEFTDVIRMARYTNNIKQVKVVLTVAHLDHDEGNHDIKDDRLKAMCQYCHLSYDQEEKTRRRKEKINS